jgi:hypothetical protein
MANKKKKPRPGKQMKKAFPSVKGRLINPLTQIREGKPKRNK